MTSNDSLGHDGLIYDISLKGHRPSYFQVFEKELGFPSLASPVRGRFLQLLRVPKLFCLTIDDYLLTFFCLALFRALRGRPTLGLSLRVENMFHRLTLRRFAKRFIYKSILRLPRTVVLSLKPFYLEPRLSEIVGAWIYDPQWWDLQVTSSSVTSTPASASHPWKNQLTHPLKLKKPLVVLPGHQSLIKGLEIFTHFAQRNPQYACVCIGPNMDIPETFWEAFRRAGGFAILTPLSEEDLSEIYKNAEVIWACYRADYDQSSGIFGRALQRGKKVCVREGSFLHQFALVIGEKNVLVVNEEGICVPLQEKKSQNFTPALARAFSVNVVRDVLELPFDPQSITAVEAP